MISLVALWTGMIGIVVVAHWNWNEQIKEKLKYSNKG